MTIIKSFAIPFSAKSNRVDLEYKKESQENRVTVIIGENGTRKSYLLRQLLESAISTMMPDSEQLLFDGVDEDVSFLRNPKKVIAVSAVPYDRFPSKNNFGETSRISRYDIDSYSYIGPRTSRNIISRNQSVRDLILNALKHPEDFIAKSPFLAKVVKEIGAGSKFNFGLNARRNPYINNGEIQTFSDYIMRGAENKPPYDKKTYRWPEHEASLLNAKLMSAEGQNLVGEIDAVVLDQIRRKSVSKRDDSKAATFQVNAYLDGGDLHTNGVSPEALYWALRFGYLQPTRINFVPLHGGKLGQEELSAGQWSFFSTMTSLALSAQDETLILVDEPESCLHPSWQRSYIDYILRAIEHVKGCHVILATHAPLLLSSIPTTCGDCVVFKKSENQTDIEGIVQPSPSGWDTSSILEDVFSINSARGPVLTDLLNESLNLIAKGVKANIAPLQSASARLKPFLNILPEDDLARDVINTIVNLSSIEN
jgi:ABC-type cobalamin/Fe3+-siderophores transport system ATPase subunit